MISLHHLKTVSLKPSIKYLHLNVFTDTYRNRGTLWMTEQLPQWLGSAMLPESSSSSLSSLIREHNSYFWAKPQQKKPWYYGSVSIQTQRMNASADIIKTNTMRTWIFCSGSFPAHIFTLGKGGKIRQTSTEGGMSSIYNAHTLPSLPLLTPYLYTIISFVVHDCFLDVSLLFLARL